MPKFICVLFAMLTGMAGAWPGATGVSAAEMQGQVTGRPSNPFDLPMQFVIVRSAVGYCEPNCPEWIYGEGQIEGTTPDLFRAILKQTGDRKLPLVILSPGGSVGAAVEMGRIIRKQGMSVEIGFTRFGSCRPREDGCKGDGLDGKFKGIVMTDGAFCWSACPLVLAGGVRRLSSDASLTGVHQVTTVYQRERVYYRERYRVVNGERKVISRKVVDRKAAGTKVTTRLPKSTRKLLVGYFKEMGIKKTLLDAMLSTPPDKIRRLEPGEMLKMGLITEESDGDVLTNAALCMGATLSEHCITQLPKTMPISAARPQPAPGQ